MTPKRFTVLEFIARFEAEHSYAPSCQEVADALGFANRSSAARHMVELARAGLIERRRHQRRRDLTEQGRNLLQHRETCPLCGNKVRTSLT